MNRGIIIHVQFAAFALLLLVPQEASGQELIWEQTGGPNSGYSGNLNRHPDGTLFLEVEGKIYASDDHGQLWENRWPFREWIGLSMSSAGVLFARTVYGCVGFTCPEQDVFRSLDRGLTWDRLNAETAAFFSNRFASGAGGRMFTLTGSGLFQSDDHASTWQRVVLPDSTLHTKLQVIGAHPDGIIAASVADEMMLYSEDNGENWFETAIERESFSVTRLFVTARGMLIAWKDPSDGILRSMDRGQTWEIVALDLADKGIRVLSPADDGRLYAGTSQGVFASADNGETWDGLGLEDFRIASIIQAEDGRLLAAAADNAVWGFHEGVWRHSSRGIIHSRVKALIVTPDDCLLAGGANGEVARSCVGGEEWAQLGFFKFVATIAVSPEGALYVGRTGSPAVYRSYDDGASWTPLGLRNVDLLVLTSKRTLLAFGGGSGNRGMYRSVDDGEVWTASGLSGNHVVDIVEIGGVLFAAARDGIYRSSDDGKTWRVTALADHTIRALAVHRGILYAATLHSLFRSFDAGETWDEAYDALPGVTFLTVAGDQAVIVSTIEEGFFRSQDGGETWESFGGLLGPGHFCCPLVADSKGHVYAGTFDNAVYRTVEPVVVSIKPAGPVTGEWLGQNYPNPFRSRTVIPVTLSEAAFLSLKIYNLLGQEVGTVAHGQFSQGNHELEWHPSHLPPGQYFYRLSAGDLAETRKLVLLP